PGEREHVVEIGERRIVGAGDAAADPAAMVDMQLQPGMPLGDGSERRDVAAGEQPDRKRRLLGRRPEPVERAVGPPRLLVRLVEGEAEAEHARALAPVRDDALALRAREVEMAEDAEL